MLPLRVAGSLPAGVSLMGVTVWGLGLFIVVLLVLLEPWEWLVEEPED